MGLILAKERRAAGVVTILPGLSLLVDAAGTIANIEAVASLGLYPYAILAPVWALWLGISLLRNPAHIQAA